MQEDYLWDKSGVPDPEVEVLEELLKPLQYQPRPLQKIPERRPARRTWVMMAAAAVLLATMTTALWQRYRQDQSPVSVTQIPMRTPVESPSAVSANAVVPADEPASLWTGFAQEAKAEAAEMAIKRDVAPDERTDVPVFTPVEWSDFDREFSVLPVDDPVLDDVTVAHIERVGLLLRSFRNSKVSEDEVAYDKQRARELLMPHTLLRRDAETTGDLAATELLNSLEPYLLDIANIRGQTLNDEAEEIKNRMQRQSIMVALQIYSPQ